MKHHNHLLQTSPYDVDVESFSIIQQSRRMVHHSYRAAGLLYVIAPSEEFIPLPQIKGDTRQVKMLST